MAKKVILVAILASMLFGCSVMFNPTKGIVIKPTIHDFKNLDVGETARYDIVITNGTGKFLNLAVIEIQGPNSDEFLIVSGGNVPTDVSPQGTHTIVVEFAPLSDGDKTAILNVEHDGVNSPLTCTLKGHGILKSGFQLSPEGYDYGNVGVGASVDSVFIVSNVGNVNLTLSAININNDTEGNYAVTDGELSGDLEITPGNTHAFTVTFTPLTAGSKTASISITHDAASVAHTASLIGTGVNDVALSPTSNDFGIVEVGIPSNPFIFTASNPTAVDVDITDIAFTGPDASSFSTNLPPAPWFIPANGGTFEIEVVYTPINSNSHSAQLSVTTSVGPLSSTVSGTGLTAPVFEITPTTHDFGSAEVGGTVTHDFIVSNPGSGVLELITSELINNAEMNFSIVSGGGSANVNPGETHTITIQFSPISEGTKSATLSIEHNANGSPFLGDLAGLGATVIMLPVTHDFGNVVLGVNPPPSQIFTVENSTSSAVTISNISIIGTNPNDFKVTPVGAGSWSVAGSGGTFNITVTCEPTAQGPLSAVLQVVHTNGILESTLNATGTASPEFGIAPTTYDFGTVTLGNSDSTNFVISNTGSGALTITRIIIQNNAGDYTITAGGTGAGNIDIQPGTTHTLTIQFEPLTFGVHNSNLRIEHNDAGNSPFNGALRGNAVGPDFRIIPNVTAHNFGDQYVGKTTRKAFYVKNAGNQNLRLTGISLSTGSQFSKSHDSVPITVTPGNLTIIYVDFTPTSTGNKNDTLSITHNSVNSPKTVTLAGTGIGAPGEITEDFDGGSAPRGWGYTGDWQWGTQTYNGPSRAHSGTRCFGTRINNRYRNNQFCYLVTPVIDLSNSVAPKLSFYSYFYTYYRDGGWLEYSTDGGNTWSRSLSPNPAYNANVNGRSAWSGNGSSWRLTEVDLTAAAGQSQVMIAWYFYSDSRSNWYGWYVDTVRLWDSAMGIPHNPKPRDNDINVKITGTSHTLRWECDAATTYDVYFGTTNPPTSLVASALGSPQYTATVANNGKYFWKVVARNSSGTKTGPVWYFEATTSIPKVLINEATTSVPDWVEFYNSETFPVYIGGWRLSTYSDNHNYTDGTFTFPNYTVLNPGQCVVVYDSQGSSTATYRASFNINWANATSPGEVVFQGPSENSFGVDYMKFNTLYTNKPADLNWTGGLTSSNSGYNNFYRNSSTDTDNASDWSVRRSSADIGRKNPGQ